MGSVATGETRDGPCVTILTAVVMVEAAAMDAAADTEAVANAMAIRMVVAGAAAAVEEAQDSSAVAADSAESRPGGSAITETRTKTMVTRRTRKASAGASTSRETISSPEPPLLSLDLTLQ